ncbi:MAG TPA: hypothetical protein VJ032_10860 [Thermoanaerobaculia bacterium]|nr:hypothetical protein [Thermoanaerobaculia bacterium]
MKRTFLAAALLFVASLANAASVAKPVIIENNASCELGHYPAATLLLPYFEVDYRAASSTAVNTIFTIVNTSRAPQIVRVTIWTDYGFPAMWFSCFLTGYDAQTFSMYEMIARGNIPFTSSAFSRGTASAENSTNGHFNSEIWCERAGGTMPIASIQRLQKILSTGQRDEPNCRVGGEHDNAVGYVTMDLVNSCGIDSPLDASYWKEMLLFDNVLTGDYERINPEVTQGNYAGGNPLVHIRAVPDGGVAGSVAATALPYTFYDRYTPADAKKIDRRQPLPSTFAARWIEGGRESFHTNYTIWREGVVGATKNECEYVRNAALPVNRSAIVRFDEQDNPSVVSCGEGNCAGSLPATSSTPATSNSIFPPIPNAQDVGGWLWMSLDNRIPGSSASAYALPRPSQNFVIVQMYAEGRYAVDFDATALTNGCTAAPATPSIVAKPADKQ